MVQSQSLQGADQAGPDCMDQRQRSLADRFTRLTEGVHRIPQCAALLKADKET